MREPYEIKIIKTQEGTDVSLIWTYGKPNENLVMEQLFNGDSITFKELQALIDAMDSAVIYKREMLSEESDI